MQPDQTAAAYGLFQVAYGYLTQQLAGAVFYLRRRNEPKLQFPQVFKKTPEQLLDALRSELARIEENVQREGRHAEPEIDELRQVCLEVELLKNWRDARVHSRVQIDDTGIAIFDWRTRRQLTMSEQECTERRECALSLALRLDMYAGQILREAQVRAKIDELISAALDESSD
jgi:hypothetical protein